MLDFTGNSQVGRPHKEKRPRAQRRSYEFRRGQVEQILTISSEMSIYDIAGEIGISPRQAFNICRRMADENIVIGKQVDHANTFKWLIRRAQ